MYQPEPPDVSGIELSADLDELVETLARHVHDVWAKQRMAEGWTYGPKRDDDRKENPCLVPYEELPESEKEYDRNTAIITLKSIIVDGYKIEKGSNTGDG